MPERTIYQFKGVPAHDSYRILLWQARWAEFSGLGRNIDLDQRRQITVATPPRSLDHPLHRLVIRGVC